MIERSKGDRSGTRLTGAPDYSRTSVGKGLNFHEYLSSGVVEVPEVENHILSLILRTGSPSLFEWRGNGGEHVAELPAGSISLFPEGMRQAVRVTRPLPGKVSILEIDSRFLARSIGQIARGGRVELVKLLRLDDPQVCRLMETLRSDVAAGSPGGPLFGESIAAALLAHISQRYSASTTKLEAYRGGLSRLRLNRVLEHINENLSDNLELSVLAEVAGVNLYHFARAFKQSTGESPHQYVLRRRIEQAKELLRHPQLSVIEASARTGFVDQSHFSKVFRRIVGIAPSEFRNNT
jgi:AraC family transcriptional regulator